MAIDVVISSFFKMQTHGFQVVVQKIVPRSCEGLRMTDSETPRTNAANSLMQVLAIVLLLLLISNTFNHQLLKSAMYRKSSAADMR